MNNNKNYNKTNNNKINKNKKLMNINLLIVIIFTFIFLGGTGSTIAYLSSETKPEANKGSNKDIKKLLNNDSQNKLNKSNSKKNIVINKKPYKNTFLYPRRKKIFQIFNSILEKKINDQLTDGVKQILMDLNEDNSLISVFPLDWNDEKNLFKEFTFSNDSKISFEIGEKTKEELQSILDFIIYININEKVIERLIKIKKILVSKDVNRIIRFLKTNNMKEEALKYENIGKLISNFEKIEAEKVKSKFKFSKGNRTKRELQSILDFLNYINNKEKKDYIWKNFFKEKINILIKNPFIKRFFKSKAVPKNLPKLKKIFEKQNIKKLYSTIKDSLDLSQEKIIKGFKKEKFEEFQKNKLKKIFNFLKKIIKNKENIINEFPDI